MSSSKIPSKPYERAGLLDHEQFDDVEVEIEEEEQEEAKHGISRKRAITIAVGFILLLLTALFARPLLFGSSPSVAEHAHLHFTGAQLVSNGTHDFRRTVVLISIDGLRADYLDRGLTPHLLDISKKGIRAKHMTPVFPTLTFPNHWALMTGLYAESHGIIANNFWDPVSQSEFHYNRIESCWNASWWLGEPMWETVEKAGVITANLMWPGPPKTTTNVSSTYFVPWADKVPLQDKLDQILRWIDLPLEERPQLIMAYEPSLDQAGHRKGPNSALVNKTLKQVDVFAKDLHSALVSRNLTDILDIVFVSDHGMTDTSHPKHIYVDDILGSDGMRDIEHEDGWPSMGLRFSSTSNESHYLSILLEAAAKNKGFSIYTHETMPTRYHFSKNHHKRIAPIYIVPNEGHVLTTRKQGDVALSKGNHGYDNSEPSMAAMFVAHGPFSSATKIMQQTRQNEFSPFSRAVKGAGWHSTSDDTYIMEGFNNVEIYSLVITLLGLQGSAASTNGTSGFWDRYLVMS